MSIVTIVVSLGVVDERHRILGVNPLVAEAHHGDTIEWTWTSDDEWSHRPFRVENFRIKESDSPFTDPPEREPVAVVKTVRTRRSRTYKYDIVLSNGERLDPEIVIYEAP